MTDGVKKAISNLTKQLGADKIKGFVVDLRNNADRRRFGFSVGNCRRCVAGSQARDASRHALISARARCRPSSRSEQAKGALQLTTARYFTPSGRSIQAKGIEPDIKVLQELPADLKARTDTESEASLRGHLKAEGNEETGSQSYVPPDEKDDRALKEALDLLRGTIADAAFPPNPKTSVP
jgi:carboxyl-terminal processing protease